MRLDPLNQSIVNNASDDYFMDKIYTHSCNLMDKVTRHNEELRSSNTSGDISYGNPMLTMIIKENQEGDQMISNMATNIDMLTKSFTESSSIKVNAVKEVQALSQVNYAQ